MIWANDWQWESIGGPQGGTISNLIEVGNHHHILAGTQWGGVFKSEDEGESWKLTGLSGQLIYSLFSTSEEILLAGTYSDGLFQSLDGGQSWESIGNLPGSVYALTQNSEGHLFAGLAWGPDASTDTPSPDANNMQLSYPGLFKSIDKGQNWEYIGFKDIPIYTLFTDENGVMYLGGKGVFRSLDSGNTWVSIGLNDKHIIVIEINDKGTIYSGTLEGEIYRSTNQGNSWNLTWAQSYPVQDFAFGQEDTVYIATDNGIYQSTTPEESWSSFGLEGYEVKSLLIRPNCNLIAGTEDNGIFKFTAQNNIWEKRNSGLTNTQAWALASIQNDLLFVGTDANGGFWFHSQDSIWEKIDSLTVGGIGDAISYVDSSVIALTRTGVYQIFPDQRNPKFLGLANKSLFSIAKDKEDNLYACSRGLYKSIDGGNFWEFLGDAFHISAIDFFSQDTILAAGGGGVYYSIDGGKNWESVYPYTMFASSVISINGYIFAVEYMYNIVIKSGDMGENWDECYLFQIGQLEHIKSTPNGTIFVAGNKGMAFTEDYGESWEIMEFDNLANPRILAIEWDQSGYIYIGTRGNGVYRSYQPQLVKVEEPDIVKAKQWELTQNYPNPFNTTTTISYQLPKSSFVRLNIYDISGRLVDKLINEKKNAGYYSVEWNAENVCSGVYFYRIEAGNFVAVKKGLLVK